MRKNGLMSDIPNTPARRPPIINPDFLTGNFTKLKSDRKLHIIRIWTPYSDLKIKIKCACAYMSSITH